MATTVSSGAQVSPSGEFGQASSGSLPIAAIVDFAAPEANVPAGWLTCDGRSISRTSFADLFNIIGTAWGAGDGSTTFAIPDLRGFALAGIDNMGGTNAGRLGSAGSAAVTLGGVMGNQTHTLVENQIPSHQHSVAIGFAAAAGIAAGPNYNQDNSPNTWSAATGGNAPHNNIQPTRVMNKIIRVLA